MCIEQQQQGHIRPQGVDCTVYLWCVHGRIVLCRDGMWARQNPPFSLPRRVKGTGGIPTNARPPWQSRASSAQSPVVPPVHSARACTRTAPEFLCMACRQPCVRVHVFCLCCLWVSLPSHASLLVFLSLSFLIHLLISCSTHPSPPPHPILLPPHPPHHPSTPFSPTLSSPPPHHLLFSTLFHPHTPVGIALSLPSFASQVSC